MKKIITLIALVSVSFSLFAQNFGGGNGSASNPWIISTRAHLEEISVLNATWKTDKYWVLEADIDLSGSNWTPFSVPFKGKIDGQGHAITNMTISKTSTDNIGLFEYIREAGVIKNLNFIDVTISGRNNVGAIVGYATEPGRFENITVTGTISGNNYVGGISGYSTNLTFDKDIRNCQVNASISGHDYVGGITGKATNGQISECQSSGIITATGDYVGGIVGWRHCTDLELVSSDMDVSGNNYVGGILGAGQGNIDGAYAFGNVTGNKYVGGAAGEPTNGSFNNVFANGNISGSDYVGGVFGKTDWVSYSNIIAASPSITITGVASHYGHISGSIPQWWNSYSNCIAGDYTILTVNGVLTTFPNDILNYSIYLNGTAATYENLTDPTYYETTFGWVMADLKDILGDQFINIFNPPTETVWTGNVNDNWGESGNWTNGVPTLNSSARLSSTGKSSDKTIKVSAANSSCKYLDFEDDYTLIIEPSAILEIRSTISNPVRAQVVLQSDATNQAKLFHQNGDISTTVEQFIPSMGTLVGAYITLDPSKTLAEIETVDGDDYMGLNPASDILLRWDEDQLSASGQAGVWTNLMTNFNTPSCPMHSEQFETGKSYFMFYMNHSETITYTGYASAQNISTNVTHTNNGLNPGANYLSVPFTTDIASNNNASANNFLKDNLNVLEDDGAVIYLWDAQTYSFTTYSNSSDPLFLTPGQGFLVMAKTNSNINFKKNTRSKGNTSNGKLKSSAAESSALNISVSSDFALTDKTVIYFGDEYSKQLDKGFDAAKMMNGTTNIYTRTQQGPEGDFAISALPTPYEFESIEVVIDVIQSGEYNLNFTFNRADRIKYYLQDKVNGTEVALSENETLSIYLDEGLTEERFYILAKKNLFSSINIDNENVKMLKGDITSMNEGINVTLDEQISGHVTVYNMLGQVIYTGEIHNSNKKYFNVTSQKGVHIVKIETDDYRTLTEKVYID